MSATMTTTTTAPVATRDADEVKSKEPQVVSIDLVNVRETLKILARGIPDELPRPPARSENVPHAPKRVHRLSKEEFKVPLCFDLCCRFQE